MGELKAEENSVLKGGSQLSFTTMQRWGERDHAWTAGDTASKSLILQFVVNRLFQGFVYRLRQNVSPAHATPLCPMLSVLRPAGADSCPGNRCNPPRATHQANPTRFNMPSTMGSTSASNVVLRTRSTLLAT